MADIILQPTTEAEMGFNDITGLEEYRVYHFADGKEYRINQPASLKITRKPEGDSHRIIDGYGIRHYIPTGWLAFSFKGKWGKV